MKKLRFGKSKFSGKGFYIALAISLVAVGTATTVAISKTIGDLSGDSLNLPSTSSVSEWGYSDVTKDVDNTKSDIPKVSSAAPSSAPASSQEPVSSAATQAKQAKSNTYAMPVTGEITKEYSNGELVKSETMGDWRTHDGIDIKGDANTPVKACCDGTVKEIKNDPMWGTRITLEHADGYTSYYYGLSETAQVKQDQTVAVGDVIGTIGTTNQLEIAEPSHLHFGMKKDGKWIDPTSVIK